MDMDHHIVITPLASALHLSMDDYGPDDQLQSALIAHQISI
jgi:hypothetical protein